MTDLPIECDGGPYCQAAEHTPTCLARSDVMPNGMRNKDTETAQSDVMTCREPGTFGSCELPAGHDGHHYRPVGAGSHSWPRSPETERLRAEVERLREEKDGWRKCALDQQRELEAKIERLREALTKAIRLARDFNRGAMTWQEYDRKLAALEVASLLEVDDA